nr:hypothetical protein [Tanacetum cinerariifolium]
ETYDFASCVSSPKTNDSFSTVDENVKPPRNLCNKSGKVDRIPCKNTFVRPKKCFVCGSKSHLIKDCNVHDTVDNFPSVVSKAASVSTGSRNSSASIHAGRSIPAASRNGSASIHAGRSIPTASRNKPASIHAGKHIPACRINKPAPFPAGRSVPTGWTNSAARPFFRPTNLYFDNVYWPDIYDHMSINKGRWGSAVHPHVNKDIGIVDSGCSRSMTGNKDKLDDFVQVKGGTVTFGGGDGKIIGRGTIMTSKLDFENVYYVEELQNFNLFSISQICDKKNKVLFTDTECLVLTKEFKLPDESQTINKLAKHGLVEGLPLKLFTNEHNCVACNKGKQHKASYKAISTVRTISKPLQLLQLDLFGPTSIKSIDHKYYSLVVTDDFSRFCWAFFMGTKDETFYILKDFIALIENQLNKKGRLMTVLVGYAAHSKAYRVYNLSRKKVEETLNLRYLEDKPNVQGLGQEWYFDLDYLTDLLGYTCFKTNPPAGTHDANILASPTVHDISASMVNNLDYAEELDMLQRQEYKAHSAAVKHGFEFSVDTAVLLPQAEVEIRRNLVPAAGDPAGSIVPTGGVPAGTSSVPAGGVLAGSIVSAEFGDPATSTSVPAVFTTAPGATSPLPPGYSLGSCEHSSRFPSPSDLGNHQPTADIFSSSSYDDDFCADVTNLVSNVDVDPVATKRVNTIHPQSQIIGALQSPIQTQSTVQKFKFGESVFISYVHNQNRNNHADHLHCLFACFLSQLEPNNVAKALEDPDWVAAMQEEMQQFYNYQDKYAKDMLKKFDMESMRTTSTPYEVPKHKSKDEPDDAVNVYLFRSMIGSLMYLTPSRPDIMFVVSACSRYQVTLLTSHLNAVKKIFKYLKGQPNLVSCGLLLYFVSNVSGYLKLQVVQLLLLVVLVHADDLVPAGSCIIPTALLYKDDHNKVAYLEKGKGWEAYEQILDFLNRSHIRYALTHPPTIVFDSLVKQFWATTTVRTLEAGPSNIIATIDGNEVVVTESLIRTQLQLEDVNELYEFTLYDVLDGMRAIGPIIFLGLSWMTYLRLHRQIVFQHEVKLGWTHMPLLAPMLVVPATGDGVDEVATGATAAHDGSPSPIIPPTHFTPGPSSASQVTPVREPTPVRGPIHVRDPIPVRDPTPVRVPTPSPVREPTPDSLRPHSPPLRTEEVGPTTSTRPLISVKLYMFKTLKY